MHMNWFNMYSQLQSRSLALALLRILGKLHQISYCIEEALFGIRTRQVNSIKMDATVPSAPCCLPEDAPMINNHHEALSGALTLSFSCPSLVAPTLRDSTSAASYFRTFLPSTSPWLICFAAHPWSFGTNKQKCSLPLFGYLFKY